MPLTPAKKLELLYLRIETIEAFLSSAFEGFHSDIVDAVANKLDGTANRDEVLAELEEVRAKYTKKRSAK
jgi:hypothetical protein